MGRARLVLDPSRTRPTGLGGRQRDLKPTVGVNWLSRFWFRLVFKLVWSMEKVVGACKCRRNLQKNYYNLQKLTTFALKIVEI